MAIMAQPAPRAQRALLVLPVQMAVVPASTAPMEAREVVEEPDRLAAPVGMGPTAAQAAQSISRSRIPARVLTPFPALAVTAETAGKAVTAVLAAPAEQAEMVVTAPIARVIKAVLVRAAMAVRAVTAVQAVPAVQVAMGDMAAMGAASRSATRRGFTISTSIPAVVRAASPDREDLVVTMATVDQAAMVD